MIESVQPASKGSKIAIKTLGVVLSLMAGSVLIGWHLYAINIIPLSNFFYSMQYNSALALLMGGLACILYMYEWQKTALFLSVSVMVIAYTTLLQYLTELNFGIDNLFLSTPPPWDNPNPGRMAPNSALCLSTVGTALFFMCSNWRFKNRQLVIRLLGTITIGFSMVGFSAWLTGATIKGWMEVTRLEGRLTLEIIILSAAPIVYAWTHCKTYSGALPPVLPIPTTLAVVLATIFLWQALSGQEMHLFQKANKSKADFIKMTLQTNIITRIDYLKQIAKRWEVRGKTPKKEWEIDSLSYIDLKSGLKVIEWADSSYHVRWVVPKDENSAAKNLDLLIDPNRAATLKQLEKQQATDISPVVNLVQGGVGFLAYIPLFPKGKFDGFIIGGFEIQSLFDAILTDEILKNYAIKVYDKENVIYSKDESGKLDDKLDGVETTISLYGNTWKLVLQPRELLLKEHKSAMPAFALFFGIFLAIVVFFGVLFAQKSYLRSRQLEKTMRALNEAKIKTEVLLHSIGEGVLELDHNRKIAFINPVGESMIGFSSENLIGQPLDNFVKLAKTYSSEINDSPVYTVFEDGKIHNANNEIFCRKDGICINVDYTCAPIRKNNEIEGAVLVFRDITNKVRVEAEAKETQIRLKSIMDNATSVIYVKDLKGKYLVANKSCLELYNIDEKDLIGKTDFDIFSKKSAEPYKTNDLEVIKEKQAINFEEQIYHGKELHTYVAVKFPLYDASDNMYAICGISTDITDRKRSEDKLLDFLKKLEDANEDLKIARMKAEEANVAKSAFLANMSHEIRTPLNGVIGMTSLLVNTILNEKQSKYVSRIHLSGKVLLEIINDILDFSKIEAGELQLEMISFDLRQLIKEIGDLMQIKAEEKQLEFMIRYLPNVPSQFIGDPVRIRQILTNLASNAIKFTNKGYVLINIEAKNIRKDEVKMSFIVEDTGIGIPKEKQEHVFEKFSQADVSTTRKFGGTGLGLAICQQLVGMMQGKVSVVSEPEKGSTFSFDIPFKIDHSTNQEPQLAFNKSTESLKGMPIIIVDDLQYNREILEEYLQGIGMDPKCCSTSELAEDAIIQASQKKMPYRIALIDHQIGEDSGYELCKKIKSNAKLKNIKVIMLTTNEHIQDKQSEQHDSFDGLLTKPIDSKELIKTISDVIQT